MKHLYTEIEIDAPVERVWDVFFDVENYPSWNPFIKSFKGQIERGKKFHVTIQTPGSPPMHFNPRCLKLDKPYELRWLGRLFIPRLFDGEHIFELKALVGNKTRFVQREKFKGILVPFLWGGLKSKTKKGFVLMNQKLKELVENRTKEIKSIQSPDMELTV